ncbi:sugar ABC transporter substrate-binding protein [Amaricoccus solimangrovi]|uniref:Sugar ABC transporter substrate-binding protein n=1 Tax=Amaricoccus solimangrovi TaxID=2589815 RepID=A0A501WIU5_9RHOB|nr:sugar ABC transporter substrate-binding protein [Amaricoccus solimangrovi]TPE49278.1 sugar ABC transporter substrate-binding protein [Amaricoccus solimangrovi]
MLRHLATGALAATLLATAAATTAPAAEIGVAMSNFDDTWLTILRDAMTKMDAEDADIELSFEDAQLDIGRQLSQVENLIAKGVDAIIIHPVDQTATTQMTQLVSAAGIPLVYVNRPPIEASLPPKVVFVASNELDSGKLEAEGICALLGGQGKALLLMGDLAYEAARVRSQDVRDVFATPECSGIEIIDEQPGTWMRTSGMDITTNWLSAGYDFDAILANNDEMALGAIQALKAAGQPVGTDEGEIKVAGIDATQDALAAMQAGDLAVTVFQDAAGQGAGAVKAAKALIAGEEVPVENWIPFELVTPGNMDRDLSK